MSLEGHLSDLSLPDILQIVHLSKKSGVLNLESPAGKGRVVFHDGQILYASMQGKERLGERLMREGILNESDLEAALRIQRDRKVYEPLGAILTENKFIEKDVLETLIQSLIKEVIYELLSWEEGVFRFEPEQPMPGIPQGISVSTEYILLEGTRLRDEGKKVIPVHEEDKPSVIKDVIEGRTSYKGPLSESDWNAYLVKHLGEGVPEEVFVASLIEDNKVTAILYGDNLPDRRPIGDTSALDAFIRISGFVLMASKS